MKTFYVGIKGVIIENGKVLLLQTGPERGGRWELPGGRMEDGETIEQTLHRELQEELPNIQNIELHEALGAYRLPKDIEGDKSLVLIFYRIEATFDGDPAISDEHVQYLWASKKEASDLIKDPIMDVIEKVLK